MTLIPVFTPTALILLSILGSATLILLTYYLAFFARLAFYRPPEAESTPAVNLPPVSIVMSARDEYHNLVNNLPALLNQDYPDFEVVIVNHTSTDETGSYLQQLAREHRHLKVISIEHELNFFKGKKFPLSIGIKSAKNEILLLTDADCKPASDQWIKEMASCYRPDTEIVVGYGPYEKRKGLLNALIRYDAVMVAMQYLSFALAKIPYMGVGRNLSYRKSLFLKNKGFTSHYKIASGDDDLFINQVARSSNTQVALQKESFVYSVPKTSLKSYIRQKRRHLTTGKHYKARFKWLLGLYSLSQVVFWLMFLLMLILNIQPFIALAIWIFKTLITLIVQKKVIARLQEPQLLLFSLAIEPLYVLVLPLFTIISSINQPKEWK